MNTLILLKLKMSEIGDTYFETHRAYCRQSSPLLWALGQKSVNDKQIIEDGEMEVEVQTENQALAALMEFFERCKVEYVHIIIGFNRRSFKSIEGYMRFNSSFSWYIH